MAWVEGQFYIQSTLVDCSYLTGTIAFTFTFYCNCLRREQRKELKEARRASAKEIPRKMALADVTCNLQLVETIPPTLVKGGYVKSLPVEHISTYDVSSKV